jgi:hypothetical protein
MEAISGFIEAYKLLLERFSFQTDFVVNADESCEKAFCHQKTWWLCPLCQVYRLCTDHFTDGVSIGEHEAGCGQASENTPSHTVGAL